MQFSCCCIVAPCLVRGCVFYTGSDPYKSPVINCQFQVARRQHIREFFHFSICGTALPQQYTAVEIIDIFTHPKKTIHKYCIAGKPYQKTRRLSQFFPTFCINLRAFHVAKLQIRATQLNNSSDE